MDSATGHHFSIRRGIKTDGSNYEHKADELIGITDFLSKNIASNNSVSETPGDVEKRKIRNSALKIFGRYRRNKSVGSGPLQIPDIENSTRNGSASRSNSASSASADKKNRASLRSFERWTPRSLTADLGTITVLKPVSEFAEPYRSSNKPLRDSTQSGNSVQSEMHLKTQTLSMIETVTPHEFENHSDQNLKHLQVAEAKGTFTSTQSDETLLSQNGGWNRQETTPTESMRSGSSFSRISNSTSSRVCPSEVSTSRGTSPDPYPPRKSSKYYYPFTNGRLINITRNGDVHTDHRATTPPQRNKESSTVSPLVFGTGTARLARSFSGAGIEKACIVRCSSPSQNSGRSPSHITSGSHTSRPNSPISAQIQYEETSSSHECKGTIMEASWMASARSGRASTISARECQGYRNLSRSSGLRSICDSSTTSPIFQPGSPSASPVSSKPISLSKIMVVANVAPDFEQFNDPTLVTIKQKSGKKVPTVPAIAIATPLNSTSSDSEDLESRPHYNYHKKRSMHIVRGKDSFSGHPRAVRRPDIPTKEHSSIQDRDLNLRLTKMERDNAMLLATLDGIVKKFGIPQVRSPSPSGTEEDMEERRKEMGRATGGKTHWKGVENEDEYHMKMMEKEKQILFSRVKF